VPVLGQALLAIAAIAGVSAAVANIVLVATGEQSWKEAIFSIVMSGLACVGLGALRGAVGTFGMAARTWRAVGGVGHFDGLGGLVKFTGKAFATAVKNTGRSTLRRFKPKSSPQVNRKLYNTKVSRQKQQRHVVDSQGNPPNSDKNGRELSKTYFFKESDAQRVLDEFHSGSARVLGFHRGGPVVRTRNVTGINHNLGSQLPHQATHVFWIKGTKSVSVVPISPGWLP
jgi:hypothetical protein